MKSVLPLSARPPGPPLRVLVPTVLGGLLGVLAASAGAAAGAPSPVSPGSPGRFLTVHTGCPTFSFTRSGDPGPGAEIDLLVYEGTTAVDASPEPILTAHLPAGATSWTAPGHDCLPAGHYAWTVRSVGPEADGPWAEPALFEVSPAPTRERVSEALEVLRRYLETREAGAGDDRAVETATRTAAELRAPTAPESRGNGAAGEKPSRLEPKVAGAGDLTVSGDFRYSEPRVRTLQVPAAAFVPEKRDGADYMVADGSFAFLLDPAGGSGSVFRAYTTAPLHLPDGAWVTAIRCDYWDKGSVDITGSRVFFKERVVGDSTTPVFGLIEIATENINQLGVASETITLDPPVEINNDSAQYFLKVEWEVDTPGSDARFYGCRLTYEHQVVGP